MKKRLMIGMVALVFVHAGQLCPSLTEPVAAEESGELSANWDHVLTAVEDKYDVEGFSADFYQKSTIEALDVTDTAHGSIFVRRPNMMRWQYEKPFPKIFVTNGERLWVYLPEDNQVQIGRFTTYFGDGKGAGFLSDIKVLREKFSVSLGEPAHRCCHLLRLKPTRPTPELDEIRLLVSKSDHVIREIVVVNVYGDENIIELINPQFGIQKDESFFTFTIPEGADVIPID